MRQDRFATVKSVSAIVSGRRGHWIPVCRKSSRGSPLRLFAAQLPPWMICPVRLYNPPMGVHDDHQNPSASTAKSASRGLPVLGQSARPDPRPKGTPLKNPPIVGFVSLGCAKNLVDSEKMLGQLAESGCVITGDESVADTVVVNTCGFLENSRTEALEVIRELGRRKDAGKLKRIVVAGCLVQRDGEKLKEWAPEIDALVGVNNRDDVVRAVWRMDRDAATSRYLGDYHAIAPGAKNRWNDQGRIRLTPQHYAYVRVSEGCNQRCTFCTIPSIRGPMHSKTPDEIVAECRELIADGAQELILIGQDTTSYGLDLAFPGASPDDLRLGWETMGAKGARSLSGGAGASPPVRGRGSKPGSSAKGLLPVPADYNLANLLRRLDKECDGAKWIRLMYVYPSIMTDEMIDAIAESERIVKYIDIPLQHINDRMLKAMHRRVTRAETEQLLEKLRTRIPGVSIRTTFIVGFPSETEAEFRELLDFTRTAGFDAAGAFQYSLEGETPAGRMKDQLAAEVKQERYDRFMRVQREVALAAARKWVGKTFEVLVDSDDPADERGVIARHAGQAPEVDSVCILPDDAPEIGTILKVKCVETDEYDLVVKEVRAPQKSRKTEQPSRTKGRSVRR